MGEGEGEGDGEGEGEGEGVREVVWVTVWLEWVYRVSDSLIYSYSKIEHYRTYTAWVYAFFPITEVKVY